MIRPRTIRRSAYLASVLAWAIGLGGFIWLVAAPIGSPDGPAANGNQAGQPTPDAGRPAHRPIPTRQQLTQLTGLSLRRPLYDPPPPAIQVVQAPPKPLPFTLVGTITEPGGNIAILKTLDGKTHMCAEGTTCEQARLLAVTEDRVRVRFDGREQTLTSQTEGRR
jgi:hypothetical protein